MLPTFAFGYDYGNAETCGFLVDGNQTKRSKIIPSATAPGSLHELANKRGASGDTFIQDADALTSNEHVITIADAEYFVGDLAINEAKASSTGRGDVNRYWSPKSLALLLTLSGEMITAPEYDLYVVTGLPIETFTKENRERVRMALDGDHAFILRGKQRRAIVHVIRVVMEGAGAMVVYGKHEDVLQGVIDIGGRTTDLYVAQAQKPQIEMCAGKPLGVETVADMVSARYNAQYKRLLTMRETRKLLRAYLGQGHYPILQSYGVYPEQEQLKTWVSSCINIVAQDILSFISTAWNTSEQGAVAADIAPMLIIGGGAYYFAHHLAARIAHAIVPMRPELANAEGYVALADVLMARQRAVA